MKAIKNITLHLILLVVFLFGIFLFQTESVGTTRILLYKEPGFSGSWSQEEAQDNYLTIKVTNPNPETLSDFQVKLGLDPANFDYTDCKDGSIGIWTDDGSTQVAYWIEEWNLDGESIVWFKAPELVADGDTEFRLYCGGEKAGQSNGDETFEFFDDFEGSLDTSKWNIYGSCSWTTQDGNLRIPGSTSTCEMETKVSFGDRKAFRYGLKLTAHGGSLYTIPHADPDRVGEGYHNAHFWSYENQIYLADSYGSGSKTTVSWHGSDSVFQIFDFVYDGAKFKLLQDGVQKAYFTDITTRSGPFAWYASWTHYPWWVNFFAVRKCRIPEPTATLE